VGWLRRGLGLAAGCRCGCVLWLGPAAVAGPGSTANDTIDPQLSRLQQYGRNQASWRRQTPCSTAALVDPLRFMNGPKERAYCPQLSPLRLPCWRLLTLARLVVVAAAIGVALVLLVLTSARDWPCSPGRADCPAAQVVGCHRRAAPAGITSGLPRQLLAGQTKGPPGGGQLRLALGIPPHHTTPKRDWSAHPLRRSETTVAVVTTNLKSA